MSRADFAAAHNLDASKPIVALLPGSRAGELAQHMPVLIEAAAKLHAAAPERQFALALASGLTPAQIEPHLRKDVPLRIISGSTYDVLAASDVAVVSSGTATVEAALIGVPMVVIYRVAPLTAWIARRLVHTPYFAMVNLIAGKQVVPELIQDNFTPARVAEETERLLTSPKARDQMRLDLAQVRARLGPPGAIDRAADIIAAMLNRWP